MVFSFFFFNDTATTEIYTLSLHDALPICRRRNRTNKTSPCFRLLSPARRARRDHDRPPLHRRAERHGAGGRSEEQKSELQSRQYLVCRLLLEKKNTQRLLYNI